MKRCTPDTIFIKLLEGFSSSSVHMASAVTAALFLTDPFIIFIFQKVRYALSFKIAIRGNPIPHAKSVSFFLSQDPPYFLLCKHIVLSFHTIAVRILSAVKSALCIRKLPFHISENLPGHTFIQLPPCPAVRCQVSDGKQRIVIQHFFKMRHQPSVICRISGKSSANMVKYPSAVHLCQSRFRHIQCLPAVFPNAVLQKEHQIMRCGKLRGTAESAVLFIEVILELPESQMYHVFSRFGRRRLFLFFYICSYLFGAVQDFFFFQLPLCSRCRQQLLQPHTAVTGCWRKIRARKKWPAVRRHDYGQRPAALPCHSLTDRHIYGINIRPFLPIHLYTNVFSV